MLCHGTELVVHPDFRALFEGLTRPRDVIGRWGSIPPDGRTRSAVQEVRIPPGRFFIKTYAYAGLWRLRTVFIESRARREYFNLLRLKEMGFNVPAPVAYGQERTLGFVSLSFLMTRAVENAVTLRELIDKAGSPPFPLPSLPERRHLIEDFARALRAAHDRGFFLHTPRFKNLLLARDEERYALYLIDVPFAGIWRYRLFPGAGRVRDLGCLMRGARRLLTRTERMLFAVAYGADRALLRAAQSYQERHYP
jgi:hypothetical protein